MAAPTSVDPDEIRRAGVPILADGRRVTGYSLRNELGGRGDPKRLLTVWEEVRQGAAPAAERVAAPPAIPLPPDLALQAEVFRDRMVTELDAIIAVAWSAAERRAAERLGDEVTASRTSAETAQRAQREADEALTAADARIAELQEEGDRALAEIQTTRAETDRTIGQRDAAFGERDRLAAELADARKAVSEAERRAAMAEGVAAERERLMRLLDPFGSEVGEVFSTAVADPSPPIADPPAERPHTSARPKRSKRKHNEQDDR